jgi:hypothetical protein
VSAIGKKATKLNRELITAAIDGFEEQKKRINAQITELRQMLSGRSVSDGATPPEAMTKQRRKISDYRSDKTPVGGVGRAEAIDRRERTRGLVYSDTGQLSEKGQFPGAEADCAWNWQEKRSGRA